jgi:hypothetical protein
MNGSRVRLLIVLALVCLFPLEAFASRAAPFKGWYEILSRSDRGAAPLERAYFLLDADILGAIWERYADGPLPEDLEQYRNEPSILAGFTNRSLIFLGLERGALIGNGYLAIHGGDGESLELRRRPDGRFDMAVKEGALTSIYLLAAPRAVPESH